MSPTDGPAVLLVNPNTNAATTGMMADLARAHLDPAGVEVREITVDAGPSMIVDPAALAESVGHVVDAVRRALDGPAGERVAAVVVGAIGDPGREELARSCGVVVVGIGQASILAAAADGRRFGMATSTPLLAESLAALVERHGKSGTFTGVRLTRSQPLVLAADPQRQFEELLDAVRACSEDDGAEAVIIAGGPLSETARRLAALDLVEIVEPVPSACRLVRDTLAVTADRAPAGA